MEKTAEPKWIPIKYRRVRTIPSDDKRYNSLSEFFNAMVGEYKYKFENNLHASDHVLVLYQKDNYRQLTYCPHRNKSILLNLVP